MDGSSVVITLYNLSLDKMQKKLSAKYGAIWSVHLSNSQEEQKDFYVEKLHDHDYFRKIGHL